MEREYIVAKKVYKKEDIAYIEVVFDNGDFVPLSGDEILDISIRLYDKLILENNEFCAFAESGLIKLKLIESPKELYSKKCIFNYKEFNENRLEYIKNRLSIVGGIKCIKFFNKNNFHTTVCGNIIAETDGDYLFMRFMSKPIDEPYESENHKISLNNITRSQIRSVLLDFENCDSFSIYANEILDMQLNFDESLDDYNYSRVIKSGFIKLRLSEDNGYREMHFYEDRKKITQKKLEQRLCGKNESEMHDICHLYINYGYTGYGTRRKECLTVNDIKSDEVIAQLEALEDETDGFYYSFEAGRATRLSNGVILITFGTSALD